MIATTSVIFLMVSNATAVPQTQNDAINSAIDIKERQQKLIQAKTELLEKIDSLLEETQSGGIFSWLIELLNKIRELINGIIDGLIEIVEHIRLGVILGIILKVIGELIRSIIGVPGT